MLNLNGILSKSKGIGRAVFSDYLLRETHEELSTTENDPSKITLDVFKKQSRKFNIDLTPKVSRNKSFYLYKRLDCV